MEYQNSKILESLIEQQSNRMIEAEKAGDMKANITRFYAIINIEN